MNERLTGAVALPLGFVQGQGQIATRCKEPTSTNNTGGDGTKEGGATMVRDAKGVAI